MPILTLAEAHTRSDSVAANVLVTPYRDAVKQWNDMEVSNPSFAVNMDATARANILHCSVIANVRVALVDTDPEVREIDSLDYFAVGFGPDMIVRFKYVGHDGPQNVATRAQANVAAQQFDDHVMDTLMLEGFAHPPTIVTCGYTLGFDGRLGRVSLQCDYQRTTIWKYVLWGDGGMGFGDFSMVPISPDLAPEPTVVVRSTRKITTEETGREAK